MLCRLFAGGGHLAVCARPQEPLTLLSSLEDVSSDEVGQTELVVLGLRLSDIRVRKQKLLGVVEPRATHQELIALLVSVVVQ